MSNAEFINEIKTRKNWIIAVTFGVLVITFIYFLSKPFSYRSTVTFFLTDDSSRELQFEWNDKSQQTLFTASNGNRFFHFAKSSQMLDYLIKKYNLYEHYNIDQKSTYHYENIMICLKSKIFISLGLYNSLYLTVYDSDKMFACEMANEMVKKLDDMNKAYLVEGIERKIKIYEQLLGSFRAESDYQADLLKNAVDDCNEMLNNNKNIRKVQEPISDLKIKLAVLSSQLSYINDNYKQSKKAYELTLASIQKENLPSISVINYALPDTRSPWIYSATWALGYCLAALCITICIIYLLREYRFQLQGSVN